MKYDFVHLVQYGSETSSVQSCNWQGVPTSNVGLGPEIDAVSRAEIHASPRDVIFKDPNYFIAGGLRRHASVWKSIPDADPDILSNVVDGVNARNFITHFKGKFGGQEFDSPFPPRMEILNSKSCLRFESFITETILERVRNGSLKFWGVAGEVEPPYLVMPITIEPTKPRMCHDERFLNLWTKDLPFSLDYLSDLPRYVTKNSFQTVCDDKSGYDHVSLQPESQTLFGLYWKNCYFVYCTLPFGWKASAFLYHSIGLIATSYIRSLGVPCSQYIDDRHIGQLITSQDCPWSDYQKAEAAAYITTKTLTSLGYTIAIAKSVLDPTQVVRYLGYLCDSQKSAFILPDDKREKFRSLRESILSSKETDLKSLQRFAGKTTSFAIAVPAARLYSRVCYRAIGAAHKASTSKILIVGDLRKEIEYWRFLDTWSSHLPWFEEHHRVITSFTDASDTGWGAVLYADPEKPQCVRDYWHEEDQSKPIVIREALALRHALSAWGDTLENSRVDAHVDSLPVVQAWRSQGGKSGQLSAIIKSIYEVALKFNVALSLTHVPSSGNLADLPSRTLSPQDCMLAASVWNRIECRWGPHTFDLMSLDSNVQRKADGSPLPHYTPWPTGGSAGVNVFAQHIPPEHNTYVFPPLVMVGPLLRFLASTPKLQVTFITPAVQPCRFWWPILVKRSSDSLRIGKKGDENAVLFPSANNNFVSKPLPWDLWAFRLVNT